LRKKRDNIGKRLRGDFNHDLQTPAAVLEHGAEAGYNQALRTVDVELNLGAHVSCAMSVQISGKHLKSPLDGLNGDDFARLPYEN
jgi:hypothetical protein